MSDLGLPYKPKTRQVQGRDTERTVLRRLGARQHPMSGAGSIKEDGSTDDELFEIKDANKSFTLAGAELLQSFKRAMQQEKEAVWIIRFANGIEATITLRRWKA